jgi:hypothetical protein
MVDSPPVDSPDELTDPQLEYRPPEPWAVGGLLLALLSPLALINWLLWLIAPSAALANAVALRRLKIDPNRSGRVAALVGLGVAVLFCTAPWASVVTERLLLPGQARPVADQFFEFLREGSPEKAALLKFTPQNRGALSDNLWTYFRRDVDARIELRKFTDDVTVRTLLALGERAQARYYKTASVITQGSRAAVIFWYTVTFTDDVGQKKTFFVRVIMDRKPTTDRDLNPWQVNGILSGVDPSKVSI